MIKHITLWEFVMQQFNVRRLIDFADNLGYSRGLIRGADILGDEKTVKELQDIKLPEGENLILIEELKKLKPECLSLDLSVSTSQIDRMIRLLSDPSITYGELYGLQEDLSLRLFDEMKSTMFLYFKPRQQNLILGEDLFGEQVAKAFPSTQYDIKHASRCLAFEEWSASIFHSMRILEIGLNTLAKELGVSFERRNWDNVLNDIEKKIKDINKLSTGDPLKTNAQFYSEAAVQFRYFKDAWRNHVMHVHYIHYDSEDAESIYQHVKEFMKHLATKLKEDNA